MPYDSNGNATVNRNRAITGQTVQAAQVNVPFDDIQSMLSQLLLRSGVAPMTGSLNMNSFRVTGISDAQSAQDAVSYSQLTSSVTALNRLNQGFITPGFNLTNSSSDPTNSISFPSGVVASDVSPYPLMPHTSALSSINAVYGTGNGGRFDSSVSDGWWHCFIISDGSTVSRGFSKSLNPTSQPNYPSGFGQYRRVGSILRDSGAIVSFRQKEDHFDLLSPIDNRISGAAQPSTLLTVSTPLGVVCQPKLTLIQQQQDAGNAQTRVGSAGEGVVPVMITTASLSADTAFVNGGVFTNTVSQIQFEVRIFTGTLLLNSISTKGWIDYRGKA